MNIFLMRCFLKAERSRPGAPKRIYEYIPYKICLKSLRGYMDIFFIRFVSKVSESRPGAPKKIYPRIYKYIPH